ncbi:hypothetical protein N824_20255 [Pedobacter sp. V48]|nr:hypothetical protein N824_20255 [Pedobacter sp. V48]
MIWFFVVIQISRSFLTGIRCRNDKLRGKLGLLNIPICVAVFFSTADTEKFTMRKP